MPANDPRDLIGGYILGSLTRNETGQLARKALEDDEVMQQMFDAEPMRDALEDPVFRAELKAALRHAQQTERPSLKDRLTAFFAQRWVLPVTCVALANIFIGVILLNRGSDMQTFEVALAQEDFQSKSAGILPVSGEEFELWRRSQESPPRLQAKASLALDRSGDSPSYAIGDKQRIGFRIEEDARVVVLEERPDGTIIRLFPSALQSESLVRAGIQVLIPPEGQGNMIVDGPPGKHKLRILMFPPNVDPLSPDKSWDELQRNAAAADRQFEVRP